MEVLDGIHGYQVGPSMSRVHSLIQGCKKHAREALKGSLSCLRWAAPMLRGRVSWQ